MSAVLFRQHLHPRTFAKTRRVLWKPAASAFDDLFRSHFFLDHDDSVADFASSSSSRSTTKEGDTDYTVQVEVPGVPKENISVELDKGVLSITGEHKSRSFKYRYQLPIEGVDEAAIHATLDNGLLTLSVPKIAPVPPRSIEIAAAVTTAAEPMDATPKQAELPEPQADATMEK